MTKHNEYDVKTGFGMTDFMLRQAVEMKKQGHEVVYVCIEHLEKQENGIYNDKA